ncbi:hypothetical protein [Noviherbaspirillum denitrificans]|uniref:Aspartate racemase n=1 Tax=Noviherbaspirillum denitrificans TaxID=1968433 RepID=A0A254TD09_9BURK|nr:hypothetical protein [Noviherbaspirillum denitrificans]OWW20530.1 hypothetical protein AYR66_14570 [Noviherbaspirillum denitrificans]
MKSPISPVIGLVSGLGLHGTGQFIERLAEECRLQYGARHDGDFPRMLVYSLPLDTGDDAEDVFFNGLRQLELAGADFLAVAGDGALLVPRLTAGVRLLHPVDLMLEAIPHSARRIALAAPQSVLASEAIQRALWRNQRKLVDPGWQDEVDAVYAAAPEARCWSGLVARAEDAGADTMLVAGFGPHVHATCAALQVIDMTSCLAHGIVAEWLAWCVEE